MGFESRFIFPSLTSHSCHAARAKQASIAAAFDSVPVPRMLPREFWACTSRGSVDLHKAFEVRVVQLIDLSRLMTSREDVSGPRRSKGRR